MLNIAIVDDHRLFRKSLALMVNSFKGINVLLEAENGQVLIDFLAAGQQVDIVLLDLQMPKMDGYQTCALLRKEYPEIRVLIISQQTARESVHRIMELGAHGYFTKNSDPAQLEAAIHSLRDRGFYFGMELGSVLKEAIVWDKKNAGAPAPEVSLTPREIDIIKLASRELSSSEIAGKLFINIRTVETHRKHIMEKTGSKNFIGVILFAIRSNLIAIEEI